METTCLGKIKKIRFGFQDTYFGLSVQFHGQGFDCDDFIGGSSLEVPCSDTWTEVDRDTEMAKTMRTLNVIMQQARVKEVQELEGIPVEITSEGGCMKSWRILEEVL